MSIGFVTASSGPKLYTYNQQVALNAGGIGVSGINKGATLAPGGIAISGIRGSSKKERNKSKGGSKGGASSDATDESGSVHISVQTPDIDAIHALSDVANNVVVSQHDLLSRAFDNRATLAAQGGDTG